MCADALPLVITIITGKNGFQLQTHIEELSKVIKLSKSVKIQVRDDLPTFTHIQSNQ